MDLSHWIERHARFAPRTDAIRFEGSTVTYGELARSVQRAAAVLAQRGVQSGDVVAWLVMNHPAVLVLILADAPCRIGWMTVRGSNKRPLIQRPGV